KRDTIPLTVNYQLKLFKKLFEGESKNNIKKWIQEKQKTVLNDEFKPEDLTIRKKISKSPSGYKSDLLHVKIAKKLDLPVGSIVSYIITKGGDSTKLDGIPLSEFKGKWDRKYYWDQNVYPPLCRTLTAAFPEEDWLKYYLPREKKIKKIKHVKL
ncbi:MAG: hypothetical protein AABY22_05010, partial [Nanoarchaeota archaeon]